MAKKYVFKITRETKSGKQRVTTESIVADNMQEAMDELDPPEGSDVDVESVTNAESTESTNSSENNSGDDGETNEQRQQTESASDDSESADSGSREETSEDENEESSSEADDDVTGAKDEAPKQGHWYYR